MLLETRYLASRAGKRIDAGMFYYRMFGTSDLYKSLMRRPY